MTAEALHCAVNGKTATIATDVEERAFHDASARMRICSKNAADKTDNAALYHRPHSASRKSCKPKLAREGKGERTAKLKDGKRVTSW